MLYHPAVIAFLGSMFACSFVVRNSRLMRPTNLRGCRVEMGHSHGTALVRRIAGCMFHRTPDIRAG
jgi:hypothetical protein